MLITRTSMLTLSATAALAWGAVGPSAARAAGGPPVPRPEAPERHRPKPRQAPVGQTLSVTVPTWQSRTAREDETSPLL